MKRTLPIALVLASLAASNALAASPAPTTKAAPPPKTAAARTAKKAPAKPLAPPPALPVAEIVARNVAARGGLPAWRAVNALRMTGEMDAGGKKDVRLPFVMILARPQKSRLELRLQDQTAVQVWDGAQGWKVRPYLNRNEVEPFTAGEARSAAAATELDGPLIDHERKGTKVELAGTEVVEGRNTYRLRLTPKGGEPRTLWIDAATFLEVKIDGEPRRMDGRMRTVAVFYRDFKRVAGLQVPHTLETVVDKVEGSHRISIAKVEVNPRLDDGLFAKPRLGSGKLATR